jgi:hypothetical protein
VVAPSLVRLRHAAVLRLKTSHSLTRAFAFGMIHAASPARGSARSSWRLRSPRIRGQPQTVNRKPNDIKAVAFAASVSVDVLIRSSANACGQTHQHASDLPGRSHMFKSRTDQNPQRSWNGRD